MTVMAAHVLIPVDVLAFDLIVAWIAWALLFPSRLESSLYKYLTTRWDVQAVESSTLASSYSTFV